MVDVLADLVTTGETATPLDAFSIGRFAPQATPTIPFPQEETHK